MKYLPEFEFSFNGKVISGHSDEPIISAARRYGIDIPHLCHDSTLRSDGNCRACMVEIQGERVLAPSCRRKPEPDMVVSSVSSRALHAQRTVIELLLSEMADGQLPADNLVTYWATRLGISVSRFPHCQAREPDRSHIAITVKPDACIRCTRCLRACREEQGNDVIGLAWRGARSEIVFDLGDPMGTSTCTGCGECVQACPTGAITHVSGLGLIDFDRSVDSLCPYCGVGCQLTFQIRDERIVRVDGLNGPSNKGRLCVKGRFGFDYVHHPHRLTTPLIRRPGVAKSPDLQINPGDPYSVFMEASWEEALKIAGGTLMRLRETHGTSALAGLGSAKGSNEEAYLFQKLVRTGFGSNNVDHCTRLCHASSVAALLEGIGSSAVSNPVRDVMASEAVLLIGCNPLANHPVAASWIKNAVRNGTKLIFANPRLSDLSRVATHTLQFTPGADVALINAMIHTIIKEGLADLAFVSERTVGYEELKSKVNAYSPETMADVCGVPAPTIRAAARVYAESKASMIIWGMGVSQHVHGTDNVRSLIALALVTGQIGRTGTGLHPLRGQNNVQGASDAGLIPMMLPDYRPVTDPASRGAIELFWETVLNPEPGLTVIEMMRAIDAGVIRGMYIMGENPAMSDPNALQTRNSLAQLEMLIVQDIFLTETAYLADVILPASAFPEKDGTFTNTDRTVQLGRKALDPPGQARQDLWIIEKMAQHLGLKWKHRTPGEVFNEMRQVMPSISGVTWARLEDAGAVTYPCRSESDPGQPVMFENRFPTKSGRAQFAPVDIVPPAELPDHEFPFVLMTGRQLEHWHTGSMTRRSSTLDSLAPEPMASMHPDDIEMMGICHGDWVTVESRRGRISLKTRTDECLSRGVLFIPFAYYEAAANVLTNSALDPYGKVPELKYCAVRVHSGGVPPDHCGYFAEWRSCRSSVMRSGDPEQNV